MSDAPRLRILVVGASGVRRAARAFARSIEGRRTGQVYKAP
jgi:hypothetical protein